MFYKKIYHSLGLIWTTIRYSRDPENVKLTFQFADHLIGLKAYDQMKSIISAHPQMIELLRTRKELSLKTLEELNLLPEGTLGKVFAQHLISMKLEIDFYPKISTVKDEHFVLQRMRAIHDILHVVTGFDTSQGGELGLQSFLMAQIASPFAMVLIGAMILFAPLKKPIHFFEWVDQISAGWAMGRRASLLLVHDWDKSWCQPLSQVREELNIIPFSKVHSV